jgi:hypothetical protein
MRFYTEQHRYYCGIDLHARVCTCASSTTRARPPPIASSPPSPRVSWRDFGALNCEHTARCCLR